MQTADNSSVYVHASLLHGPPKQAGLAKEKETRTRKRDAERGQRHPSLLLIRNVERGEFKCCPSRESQQVSKTFRED